MKNYLYVNYYQPYETSNLLVLNISDPTTPFEVEHIELRGTHPQVKENYAYTIDLENGLQVLDVSNPAVPTEIEHLPNLKGLEMLFGEEYVYVSSLSEGLRVLDISNPAHPIQAGVVGSSSFGIEWGDNQKLAIAGDYVYLVSRQGLRVIDISNPFRPTEVDYYPLPDIAGYIEVVDGYLYITTPEEGLFIFQPIAMN